MKDRGDVHSLAERSIYITGGSGWLARAIARALRDDMPDVRVILVSRSLDTFEDYGVECITNRDFISKELETSAVVVHCAFCRKSQGDLLVESLEWSRQVFVHAARCRIRAIVNISSQAAYDGGGLGNTEDVRPAPTYLYAMSKVASEVLLDGIVEASGGSTSFTNLRMASLIGVSDGESPVNVTSKFIDNALAGTQIEIVGGRQNFSFLDIEDAANAVLCLLSISPQKWSTVYNVGPSEQTNICSMAEVIVARVACLTQCCREVPIRIDENEDIKLDAGMDSTLFSRDTGWCQGKTLSDTIDSMIRYAQSQSGKKGE